MGQLQKFTKLLLKQSQSNFGYVSIPKDPNIVLNYEKAKYSNPSVCTTLDLYEFDLYELFLLTKTFDLYECHSICTSF